MVVRCRQRAVAISATVCLWPRIAAIVYLSSALSCWYRTKQTCRTYFLNPSGLTRRQSQRPWLSRLVLRAARAAPATVVAHLERWAEDLCDEVFQTPLGRRPR